MTAQAVADLVGGRLSGSGDLPITSVRALDRATGGSLSICGSKDYLDAMAVSAAAAVIVPDAFTTAPGPSTRIAVADPQRAMLLATEALYPESRAGGIDPSARIGRHCRFGAGVHLAPGAVIGDNVSVGDRVQIGAHAAVGDGATLGDDCDIGAHVVLHAGVVLGHRVRCKAGAVIGGPGFGFISGASGHQRIPQVGGCILEDDVEVGSNSCIDRGSLDDTRIGRGTKIDNLVQIAHNVQIGSDCLIMAGVGIAGSTRLGNRVVLAGQVGCADHLRIGDDARAGARAAILSNVAAGSTVTGYPATGHREFLRGVAATQALVPHLRTLLRMVQEREDA
jgi:UDP-3-O-[3-hydroxymyristoyl] glucosamine N-acyltransferase